MKILVVAEGVATRQWLGRLFNEAGVCFDRRRLCELCFVKSIRECLKTVCESGKGTCRAIVWNPDACVEELIWLAKTIPTAVILGPEERCPSLANSNCRVIGEDDLDAGRLLAWMESPPGDGSPSPQQNFSATP